MTTPELISYLILGVLVFVVILWMASIHRDVSETERLTEETKRILQEIRGLMHDIVASANHGRENLRRITEAQPPTSSSRSLDT